MDSLPGKPFSGLRRITTDDRELLALQQRVEESLLKIAGFPILAGSLVKSLQSTATDTDVFVYHELGRVPQGYVLTGSNGPLMLYTSPTANSLPNRQLILRANYSGGGSKTFSVWVF